MTKVCKFGGTSMADGTTIWRVREIAKSDSTRRFFIVSAPGKRYGGEKKVTDLLYTAHTCMMNTGVLGDAFEKVKSRFRGIVGELKMENAVDIEGLLKETEREILAKRRAAFTVSRGEYLAAKLMADYLQLPFVDARDVVRFDKDGSFLPEETYSLIAETLKGKEGAVLPGFYGADEREEIHTFSRGGGDISGAIVARAIGAELYENWTDVSGFLVCDPRIVENPAKINELTFEELKELSRMGASVLHTESIFPVREADIPVCIKNTFRPQDEGTLIIPASKYRGRCPVTGIAGKRNYTAIFLEGARGADALSAVFQVLSEQKLGWELISSDAESALIVAESRGAEMIAGYETVKSLPNLALIAIVGQGLKGSIGVTARIFKAIAQAGVSVKMIGGASELKLLLGVDNEDYERTIRAVYDEFYKD